MLTFGMVTGCSSDNGKENIFKKREQFNRLKVKLKYAANPQRIVDISGSSEELVLLGHTPVATANVDSYETTKVPSDIEDKLGDAKVVGHSMMDTMDIEAILSC